MQKENLSEFIRRIYLERASEMPALSAMDFEDAIYLGIQWQKDQTEMEAKELIKQYTANLNKCINNISNRSKQKPPVTNGI